MVDREFWRIQGIRSRDSGDDAEEQGCQTMCMYCLEVVLSATEPFHDRWVLYNRQTLISEDNTSTLGSLSHWKLGAGVGVAGQTNAALVAFQSAVCHCKVHNYTHTYRHILHAHMYCGICYTVYYMQTITINGSPECCTEACHMIMKIMQQELLTQNGYTTLHG